MNLSCLIVDDEPIARRGLAEDISHFDFLKIAGLAENAFQALRFLNENPAVDLLFLDIDMPGLNGLDFLKLVRVRPLVIITTAYPQFAVNGFDLDVIDYLLKPISPQRLETAINKAKRQLAVNEQYQPVKENSGFLYVKSNGKFEKILLPDILYIEAANNYVFIHTAKKRFVVYNTLKGIEEQLPANQFVRVHKSFVVSRSHIARVDGMEVIINQTSIPISRNFKSGFHKEVIGARSLKRE